MITNRKLKATHFFTPYNTTGSYNLKATGKGVYMIKKGKEIVYVGLSLTDVRSTMYRHFQQWTDRRSVWSKKNQIYDRVTYHGERRSMFTVKVIFCPTDNETRRLEALLIKKLKPRDNVTKNELYNDQETEKMIFKFNEAESWKPMTEENPF